MTGKVWQEGDHWIATIADWWYARGKSESEAVRKVTAKYEQEMERMNDERDR